MPTGYTACIEDGCTFKEYALRCAKAFGACVTMRDDPGDKPIPEKFEPSSWNAKELAKAQARLKELDGMTLKQAAKMAENAYEEAEGHRLASLKRERLKLARYQDMRKKVLAYVPPSPDHEEYRKFMLDQIDLCIKPNSWGGPMVDYYEKPTERLSAEAWLAAQKTKARRDIAYHTEEHRKETERVEGRNRWIKQLRESLR